MLALVGWQFATKESKRKPFAPAADVLGAVLDLSKTPDGQVLVSNKPSRIADLEQTLARITKEGWMSQPAAVSLRGRFVYAEAQTFSRAAAFLLMGLKRRSLPGAPGGRVDEALIRELQDMLSFLQHSIPRRV